MLHKILTITAFVTLAGCSANDLTGNVRVGTQAPTQNAALETDSKAPEPQVQTAIPATEVISDVGLAPGVAAVPVSVGGGFLTCTFDELAPLESQCETKTEEGVPLAFGAVTAYIVSGVPLTWKETQLQPLPGIGLWKVSLPAGINTSFGISLKNGAAEVLTSWIDRQEKLNLVGNGGFEAIHFNPIGKLGYLGSEVTSKLAETFYWKADRSSKVTSTCPDVFIELQHQTLSPEIPAPDGDQWVDLDSACAMAGFESLGLNLVLYQDIKALEAGHIYELSFAYRDAVGSKGDNKFSVTFGDFTATQPAGDTNWKKFRKTSLWKGDNPRLAFEELGPADIRGSIIDNVRVIDMGKAP